MLDVRSETTVAVHHWLVTARDHRVHHDGIDVPREILKDKIDRGGKRRASSREGDSLINPILRGWVNYFAVLQSSAK